MSRHASFWIADRDGGDGVVRQSTPTGATKPAGMPPLGVWLLLATIAATSVAMAAAILWAAPTVAASTLFAVVAPF